MSKTVPSTFALPSLNEFTAGGTVDLADWDGLAESAHYLWARQGSLCPGLVFDTQWSTNSTSYVTANAATYPHYDLDDWQGLFRFSRVAYGTGAADQAYRCQFDVYAKNLDVRLTMVRLDTEDGHSGSATTVHTLATSHASADSDWATDYQEYTKAEASRGGTFTDEDSLAFFLCYVEAKVPSAGTGELWAFGLREAPITSGLNLPRGSL